MVQQPKDQKTFTREEILAEDKWNVEALYPSFQEWEKDMQKWGREEKKDLHWPEFVTFKGNLGTGTARLLGLLKEVLSIERNLYKLYTYAHLRHDEDVGNDAHKKAFTRISKLLFDLRQETSWIEPEILALPEATLRAYLQDDALKEYHIYLEKIVRMKPHTLSAEKEELLALAGNALQTSSKAFGGFNNADLKFPMVEDSEGKRLELTHGKYLFYMRQKDRKLRKEAFQAVHKSYLAYENTLCELINGQVQTHLFNARARGYSSCLEAALFPNQIDTGVYFSLIQAVRKNLGALHRYMAFRKKVLGYGDLHPYDLHVPLVDEPPMAMGYDEAVKQVIQGISPLGQEYQKEMVKGLTKDRWVDKYENQRKRSGAYSSGCYDSFPYILLNYQGTFNDLMTLAHEAGHSMHSLFSHRHQPFHYSDYSIFVAEVASTFNEELVLHHLLKGTNEKKVRAFLLNQKIEDIRNTFFRQTMFAEFELKLHEWAEKGVPLTPALLRSEYRKLNQDYFGSEVVIDEEIEGEWARIPHFYYNFYVYQYATGISAAHKLVEEVLKGGKEAQARYLTFLSSGSSKYPLELLRLAGVDMQKPDAVEATIRHFEVLVQELEGLLQ